MIEKESQISRVSKEILTGFEMRTGDCGAFGKNFGDLTQEQIKKAFQGKKHLEDDMQVLVANYIRSKYPHILFHHSPSGGVRSAREGARFKRMGTRAGCPDILIFSTTTTECGFYCGLALELKVKPNKPSKEQKEFMGLLLKQLWKCYVCYSFDEAKIAIDDYLSNGL